MKETTINQVLLCYIRGHSLLQISESCTLSLAMEIFGSLPPPRQAMPRPHPPLIGLMHKLLPKLLLDSTDLIVVFISASVTRSLISLTPYWDTSDIIFSAICEGRREGGREGG